MGLRLALRADLRSDVMDWIHLVGGVTAVGLIVYLMIALIKPEWFK